MAMNSQLEFRSFLSHIDKEFPRKLIYVIQVGEDLLMQNLWM